MGSETCALLCVYDGHGESGDMVSNYVMNEMPNRLAGHPRLHDNPELALQETFEEVDKALREAAKDNEHVYSGTTAAVVLYRDDRVWVANAGDSRVVLGTEKRAGSADGSSAEVEPSGLVPVALSDDHNPDKPEELERIESCGGFVSPPPEEGLSARVWLDQELTRIGLAMSRSIGDHAVKEVGVIATPEIKVRSISEGDAFLVLASDGVWEFMGNQQSNTTSVSEVSWTSVVSGFWVPCWAIGLPEPISDICALRVGELLYDASRARHLPSLLTQYRATTKDQRAVDATFRALCIREVDKEQAGCTGHSRNRCLNLWSSQQAVFCL
ncbi:conserved unknown protein [Ectocarpus siliculosus]|uniref:PPM-type phosphatase domain-containing protein n=1 Tax=Ectocarpus siliculosus TaxID=2880 RepID=D7FV04_ECTSI|nr:conserved unknown protein [Ectocarpus siliculosus]|eukprot:CBJ31810.1 conserved unknown protein [Ectocarpus siliculosus]